MKRFLVSILFVAGCSTTASENIQTSGIRADITIQADSPNTASVAVNLRVGDSLTFLDLVGGDVLYADAIDSLGATIASKQLTKGTFFGATYYGANFTETDSGLEGTQYVIDFERTSDVSAPSSSVTLPKAIGGMGIQGNNNISRASNNDITFTWQNFNGGLALDWAMDGTCIVYASGNISSSNDGGSYAISGTLDVPAAGITNEQCSVDVDLIRHRPGVIDAALGGGGQIDGQQYGYTTFTSQQ